MDRIINSLVLKSNRALSSRLSEVGLVGMKDLDAANEIFVSSLREKDVRYSSLLRVLLFETQSLKESDLLGYQLRELKLGAIPLGSYHVSEELIAGFRLDECIATWTLPVDLMGEIHVMASAYYLSDFVRQFWEQKIGRENLLWSVCPYMELDSLFEKLLSAVGSAENSDTPA